MPDEHTELGSYVENDREIACELRETGTHTGPLPLVRTPTAAEPSNVVVVAPTGRHVAYTYSMFVRVAGDQVVNMRTHGVMCGMAEQLGVLSFTPAK